MSGGKEPALSSISLCVNCALQNLFNTSYHYYTLVYNWNRYVGNLLNICFYIIDLYSNGGGGEWPMLRDCDICTNKMFLTRIYLLGPLNCLNSHFFSDQLFQTKLSIPKKFCTQFFGTQHVLYSKFFWTHNFFGPEFLLDPKCLNPYYFLYQIKVLTQIFGTKQKFWTNYFFGHTIEFSASLKN